MLLTPVSQEDRARPGAAVDSARRQAAAALFPFETAATAGVRTDRDAFLKALHAAAGGAERFSRFEAPWTVEVHAYHQPAARRLVLHFVNYNHREKAVGTSAVAREAPIPAEPVAARLHLPDGFRARAVTFASPDEEKAHTLEFTQRGRALEFRTPPFLVYGVCTVSE